MRVFLVGRSVQTDEVVEVEQRQESCKDHRGKSRSEWRGDACLAGFRGGRV